MQLKSHFLILMGNFDDFNTNQRSWICHPMKMKKKRDDDDDANSGVIINASTGIFICI